MKTTFIYGLNDPTTGECRYVGKADKIESRLYQHVWNSKGHRTHKDCWIRGLALAGLSPKIEVLQEVPFSEWQLWERVWISASRKIGYDLTNLTDGGDGASGNKLSSETKEKIRVSVQRAKRMPECREKTSRLTRNRLRKDNTSGCVGVCFDKSYGKWLVRIRRMSLGYFSDKYDAIFVRRLAVDKYFS